MNRKHKFNPINYFLLTNVLVLSSFMGVFSLVESVQADDELSFQKMADLRAYKKYIVFDDSIFAYKDDKLKKLDITGKEIWTLQSDSGNFQGEIGFSKTGDVYIGTETGYVVSIAPEGQLLKKYKIPGEGTIWSANVADNGDVFVLRNDYGNLSGT